jgi:uncharacterized protein (TIGR02466 family)
MPHRAAKHAPRVVPLFETPIYVSDAGLAELRPRLLRLTRALQRRDPEGAKRSNLRGWHSHGNLLDEEDAVVPELEKAIRVHVSSFLGLLSKRRRRRFEFGLDAWINVNEHGASNSRHVHPNAFLSGAYYLKVPPKMRTAQFVVWDPRGPKTIMHGAFVQSFTFPWNHDSFTIDVRTGRTLIFPAWLEHEVTPLEEDVERISIAFNVRRRA